MRRGDSDDGSGRATGSQLEFEARVGTWLRRKWKLERLIGTGGMAGVYVGSHKIGRTAAIKILRPEIAVDERLLERFEQEARAVNAIGHPGVVEILDIDEDDDGSHFLVMELLEGETLADRVDRDGPPAIPTLLDYVDQTLDVLVACHRKGIIHRDIKPENLFIQKNGRLKVLDFGIARVREGVKTIAGTMLGTMAFMPPEQLRGAAVDARADLYALGATVFTVLSGRRVHQARGDAELAARVLSKPAPSLASVYPKVPEHVGWVVDRALAYLPERRYPDAQTMRGDVWSLQRGGRPPYANACREAGQRPDVTTLEPTKKTRPDAPVPSTDPQLPAFQQLPSTDPQMPVFVPEVELEPTKPQTPVLTDSSPARDSALSEPESAPSSPGPSESDRQPPMDVDAEPDSGPQPESEPESKSEPESERAPQVDEDAHAEAAPSDEPPAPARPARTLVGFPQRKDDRVSTRAHDDDDADEGSDDDGDEEEIGEDRARDDEGRDDHADENERNEPAAEPRSGGRAWWWAIALVIAAGATAGAWAAGFLP